MIVRTKVILIIAMILDHLKNIHIMNNCYDFPYSIPVAYIQLTMSFSLIALHLSLLRQMLFPNLHSCFKQT